MSLNPKQYIRETCGEKRTKRNEQSIGEMGDDSTGLKVYVNHIHLTGHTGEGQKNT